MTRNTQGRPGTGELRKGYTTGACATAATAACAEALLTGHFPDPVTISLPRGASVAFSLAESSIEDNSASAGIIKDAGDDPDVTHGALIRVTLRRGALGKGITFYAGEGVGTVTRPGLALSPGEAAINPVPREMMTNAVSEIAAHHGAQADFEITVSVPGGEKLAEKTLNGRLGIIGGLSILGTTGIVVPYSCSAWVHAIHRGIDVARAGGETHLVAATGRTSELAAQKHCGASETALIEMGDFAGGVLKYLRDHPVPRLTLAGGFAKISKLAAGHMDLHSARSQVDMAALKSDLEALGAGADLLAEAEKSIAAGAVFELAQAAGLPLADRIAAQARDAACEVLVPSDGQRDKDKIAVDVLVFDRCGRLIGAAVAP